MTSKRKLTLAATSPFLNPGTAVEISPLDDGFHSSWFTGKIVRLLANNKVSVEYDNLFEDEQGTKCLRESLNLHQLRPLPPPEPHHDFKFGDLVDAFHDDGWWEGYVTRELGNDKFAVVFRASKEKVEFSKEELRPHREWIDEDWFPPIQQPQQEEVQSEQSVKQKKKKKEELFRVGAAVEVRNDEEGFQGAWCFATILERRRHGKFLVEYKIRRPGNDPKRAEIDALHIRPPAPETGVTDFNLLDMVDALYPEGWWVGVISKVLGDSKYLVYFSRKNKVKKFHHSKLRLHQCFIDGKWVKGMTSKKTQHYELLKDLQLYNTKYLSPKATPLTGESLIPHDNVVRGADKATLARFQAIEAESAHLKKTLTLLQRIANAADRRALAAEAKFMAATTKAEVLEAKRMAAGAVAKVDKVDTFLAMRGSTSIACTHTSDQVPQQAHQDYVMEKDNQAVTDQPLHIAQDRRPI